MAFTLITRLDYLLIFVFVIAILSNRVLARNRGLIATISKTETSPFYFLNMGYYNNYIMDLDSNFLWTYCHESPPFHIAFPSCPSTACSLAKLQSSPQCPSPIFDHDEQNSCPCAVYLNNPVLPKTCDISEITYEFNFIVNRTDGYGPTQPTSFRRLYAACFPFNLFISNPDKIYYVAGLSNSPFSLPSQFSNPPHRFARKFAFILPQYPDEPGTIFFGGGPYYATSYRYSTADTRGFFTYTRLLKNPKSPNSYYIGVQAISIGKSELRQIPVRASSFALNYTSGRGGVKLSTTVPYTTLRSDIYVVFREKFLEAAKGVTRMKAVKPFEVCFKAEEVINPYPYISDPSRAIIVEMRLGNGQNWTHVTKTVQLVNSGARLNETLVACMAFVDGGKEADQAMVIGGFQMEDNMVQIDLDKYKFGFIPKVYT